MPRLLLLFTPQHQTNPFVSKNIILPTSPPYIDLISGKSGMRSSTIWLDFLHTTPSLSSNNELLPQLATSTIPSMIFFFDLALNSQAEFSGSTKSRHPCPTFHIANLNCEDNNFIMIL